VKGEKTQPKKKKLQKKSFKKASQTEARRVREAATDQEAPLSNDTIEYKN
jgi:hypothetical protein